MNVRSHFELDHSVPQAKALVPRSQVRWAGAAASRTSDGRLVERARVSRFVDARCRAFIAYPDLTRRTTRSAGAGTFMRALVLRSQLRDGKCNDAPHVTRTGLTSPEVRRCVTWYWHPARDRSPETRFLRR